MRFGVSQGCVPCRRTSVRRSQNPNPKLNAEKRQGRERRQKVRVKVKTPLKPYKYPPDQQEEAIDTVLRQVESLSAEWASACPFILGSGIRLPQVVNARAFNGRNVFV